MLTPPMSGQSSDSGRIVLWVACGHFVDVVEKKYCAVCPSFCVMDHSSVCRKNFPLSLTFWLVNAVSSFGSISKLSMVENGT